MAPRRRARRSFSNHGDWVTCCTEGENVVSTFVTGWSGPTEDAEPQGSPNAGTQPTKNFSSGWASWSGTSFAAPKVAAAIARRVDETGHAAGAGVADASEASTRRRRSTWASRSAGSGPIVSAVAPGTLTRLVAAAAAGDAAAWEEIVERFSGLVWATARAHRLARDDAADVAQTTWLRLVEHLDRIRDPEQLGAWLATTARRESLRLIRLRRQEQASDDVDLFEAPSDDALERLCSTPTAMPRSGARSRSSRSAARRSCGCSSSDAEPSYEEIAAALGMPIGSIGPTRMRCLDRLQRSPELAGLVA